jgi:GAF domain-containing protein
MLVEAADQIAIAIRQARLTDAVHAELLERRRVEGELATVLPSWNAVIPNGAGS